MAVVSIPLLLACFVFKDIGQNLGAKTAQNNSARLPWGSSLGFLHKEGKNEIKND